jgi:hypothetical protein
VATWAKQANRPLGFSGPIGQVGPAERLRTSGEGEASRRAGPKAEWAGKGSWAESEKLIGRRIFRFKIGFLNLPRLWKFAQGDFGGIWT